LTWRRPTACSKTILIDNRPPPGRTNGQQVLDPAIADNVTNVLRGVISEPGATGTGADIGRPAAGKTGTTTDYDDAWFVGYTPTLSTAVWMGNKDKETHSLRGTKGVGAVFGGTFPARTWAAFMREAMTGVAPTDFNQPPPLRPIADELDREQRGGIDPGVQRGADVMGGGGPYQYGPAPPVATAPTTTSTTVYAPPVTTTTTPPPTTSPGPTLPIP
jgi:membrane peptidoglycan carboxypeptidase